MCNVCVLPLKETERSYDEHGVQFPQGGDVHVEVSTLACGHYLFQFSKSWNVTEMKWSRETR